jgi:N-acetylmuramic acid 6-phosphate etherase
MSSTEKRNPLSRGIDALSTAEVLRLMLREDASVIEAVKGALPSLEKAVEDAAASIKLGGRVCYAGAGTSGRLGVLDASEVMPTFGSRAFGAVIAGGEKAVTGAVEGAEDDGEAGSRAAGDLTDKDMAVGISASGGTPFVLAFLKAAKEQGARCWLITCNDVEGRPFLDGMIKLLTGPEVVAGSTRLKAGTATKIALNMLSTAAMIKLGGVYDGLMVDVVPTNRKLIKRAEGIVREIAGCTEEEAARYLKLSGMRPKVAVVMLKQGASKEEAERLLEKSGGSLRKTLG